MKDTPVEALVLEPERYELVAEIEDEWEAARREFFAFLGGGIVVVYALEPGAARLESQGRRGGPGVSLPQEIGVWLHIGEDGHITGAAGKVEVGQNIRTTLAKVIAGELPVPLETIQLVLGDTEVCPFDFGTVGSRSTPVTAPQFRKAAAAACQLLLELAATRTGSEPTAFSPPTFSLCDGQIVHHPTGQTFTVAELVRGQQRLLVVDEAVETQPATRWQGVETPTPQANGRAQVTGQHRYTSDFKRPGMAYGKVLRPPAIGVRRLSLDARAALALPGVTLIEEDNFVGVVAPDETTATRAVEALHVVWERAEAGPATHEIYDYLKSHPAEPPRFGGPSAHVEGSLEAGLAESDHVCAATYTVAYIAHAPLEPRAAVAEWDDEGDKAKLTVWTGTQRPFGVREELAGAFSISEDRIRVIVPDTGSGYGGKHTGDAAIEAARLARVARTPVKLVWTREEEFKFAYLRPAGVIEVRGGVRSDGTLTAWEHHNTNSGASAIRTLYRVPNQRIEFHPAHSPLRQGSYRALAATANHFARESHMDELAHAAGHDPLDFRLHNLDDSRLRAVLEAAAERFGWGLTPKPRHGFGIAGGHEKGSYVATCAEVFVDPANGGVRVVRAVTAFECGALIDADTVRHQVEGAVIQGLGGALFEAIEFENGEIQNACFSRYRLPRFSDIPHLETVLLDRKDLPSVGAGETPIVAIAPAIGNAIFAATGVRVRSLPLAPAGVKPDSAT